MAVPIEDVLSVWRELERVHDALPADAPERTVIQIEIGRMRAMYRSMAARRTESNARLTAAWSAVDDAWAVLKRAEARLRPEDEPASHAEPGPRFSTFPAQDEAFQLFVESTWKRIRAAGRPLTTRSLEAALRTYHSRALVRARSPLATLGQEVWYVYRDGRAGVRVLDDWWQCDDCASVVFDRGGAFVEADDAACALVGVPPGSLVGRQWRDFVRGTEARDDRASLWSLLETHGFIQSVFDVALPDGGFRVIEYHSERTDDPDRFTSRWRAIAELSADEATSLGTD